MRNCQVLCRGDKEKKIGYVWEPTSSALAVAFFFLRRASNSVASKAKRSSSSADSAIVLSGVLVSGSFLGS